MKTQNLLPTFMRLHHRLSSASLTQEAALKEKEFNWNWASLGYPMDLAWTQTRFVLPAWLGVEAGLRGACDKGRTEDLKRNIQRLAFFRSTLDLIEMVLQPTGMMKSFYPPSRQELGSQLRMELATTEKYVLVISGHEKLYGINQSLRRLIENRLPYLNPMNMLQVEILKRLRNKLTDALLITINGIALGMRNTG